MKCHFTKLQKLKKSINFQIPQTTKRQSVCTQSQNRNELNNANSVDLTFSESALSFDGALEQEQEFAILSSSRSETEKSKSAESASNVQSNGVKQSMDEMGNDAMSSTMSRPQSKRRKVVESAEHKAGLELIEKSLMTAMSEYDRRESGLTLSEIANVHRLVGRFNMKLDDSIGRLCTNSTANQNNNLQSDCVLHDAQCSE